MCDYCIEWEELKSIGTGHKISLLLNEVAGFCIIAHYWCFCVPIGLHNSPLISIVRPWIYYFLSSFSCHLKRTISDFTFIVKIILYIRLFLMKNFSPKNTITLHFYLSLTYCFHPFHLTLFPIASSSSLIQILFSPAHAQPLSVSHPLPHYTCLQKVFFLFWPTDSLIVFYCCFQPTGQRSELLSPTAKISQFVSTSLCAGILTREMKNK